jgi:hypothetical protein
MSFEIYTTDQNYYEHKVKLKSVLNSFGLKWNNGKSGWFNRGNSVIKQSLNDNDRLLIVSGSSDFIEVMQQISDSFFTDERVEKQKESLEDFIIKRVEEKKAWAEVIGYDIDVVEYFTIREIIDLNS